MSKVVSTIFTKSGHVDFEQVSSAANILHKGGVVALPTDTIYGIAAKVDNLKALDRVFKIKGRDLTKPLSVCVASIQEVEDVAETSSLHPLTLSSLLPGPVTLLLKRTKKLNLELNPGLDTVGIRVPDQNFILSVCRMTGPLALTSANRSGDTNPLQVSEFEELWPELDCIYDCGLSYNHMDIEFDEEKKRKAGSTVIDLSMDKKYLIVREGVGLSRSISTLNRLGYRRLNKV